MDKNCLTQIEQYFLLKPDGLDIVDFVRVMLNNIEHNE